MFSHEKLDVYRVSIDFIALSMDLQGTIPRGSGEIRDQLKRASLSIPLNIAEGVGKFSKADKTRFFAIARGSALECAALMDICRISGFFEEERVVEAKDKLARIASMLTRMIR